MYAYTEKEARILEKPFQMRAASQNITGINDLRKTRLAHFSGFSFDEVSVPYNSGRPGPLHTSSNAPENQSARPGDSISNDCPIQCWSLTWSKNNTIETIETDRPTTAVISANVLFPKEGLSTSHTSAFVLMQNVVEQRLIGKSYLEALLELNKMVLDIMKLPGYKAALDRKDPHKLADKTDELSSNILSAHDSEKGIKLHYVQEAVLKKIIEDYFVVRNSVDYTFHCNEDGGGAANEAGNMHELNKAVTFEKAYPISNNLFDAKSNNVKNYAYLLQAYKQHLLTVSSYFSAKKKDDIALKFITIANNDKKLKGAFESLVPRGEEEYIEKEKEDEYPVKHEMELRSNSNKKDPAEGKRPKNQIRSGKQQAREKIYANSAKGHALLTKNKKLAIRRANAHRQKVKESISQNNKTQKTGKSRRRVMGGGKGMG